MYEYDNTLAYVDLPVAQQFLGIGDSVTGIEVRVDDIYKAGEIAEALKKRLGSPFYVSDWIKMNSNFFSALKLEKAVMFVILTLIILVAAFNIVSSLTMLVMEKGRDIAILKAMGATTASIRKIFVLEGFPHRHMRDRPGHSGRLHFVRSAQEVQIHRSAHGRLSYFQPPG